MEKYIMLVFLVSSVLIVCSARVIDPVNLKNEASSISNVGLESSFGGSPAHLSALAGETEHSDKVLSRQKRFLFPIRFRWVIRSSSGSGGNDNGGNNNDPIIVDEGIRNANARTSQTGSYNGFEKWVVFG